MQLLVATSNAGKIREIAHELAAAGLGHIKTRGLRDLHPIASVVEDQPGFAGNAMKKAAAYARESGLLALADDSGLCVDALAGAPGVLSARYAGEPCNDDANNRLLLHNLRDVPEGRRSARFVCAVALAAPQANIAVMVETVEGVITHQPRGSHGFGYDPLFYIPALNRTTAELSLEEKAALSHRGKAVRLMLAWMKDNMTTLGALVSSSG